MARTPQSKRYDKDMVVRAASGRWPEIISTLGGVVSDTLDGGHHPCPKCGGKDRFRFSNRDGRGSVICGQCFKSGSGDGIDAVEWLCGWDFPQALEEIAKYLGITPETNGNGKEKADPEKDLKFLPWNDLLAAMWCDRKRPISPSAIQSVGGRLARYKSEYTVIAIPIWKQGFTETSGWCLYNTSGKPLPTYSKNGSVVDWVKIKMTAGSRPGVIGLPGDASVLWKTEGPSDLLALLSLGLPQGHSAICNAMGSTEDPLRITWLPKLVEGRTVYVIHDSDRPGQEGAAKWSAAIAASAIECRNVALPFESTETHGNDLRDWLSEGKSYQDLLDLAGKSNPITAKLETQKTLEADDDPHRLARANLERYATSNEGRTLRYWRDEWYVWKRNRYRHITERELRAKITQSIKDEFDRCYLDRAERSKTDEPETARKVTQGIVSNVIQATAGMTVLSSEIELNTWLDDRSRRSYISMENGILDLESVMADRDVGDCLLPHSPKWFSLISVPYAFDQNATCPRWLSFLQNNLEGDHERIAILQEWAGYLLLPDTGQQKFLVLEGEGANGKSVYCSAITSMLGGDNVSNIQLEVFGERFSRTDTLGKLANVCGDVGELDKVSEGYVKSFTSGDRMYFDRKGVQGINVTPTARLMLACNHRPRFSDRSDGVWRRMIPVPFRVQIKESDRVIGMDKAEWWKRSGELPGIFNWAVIGLARLRSQGRFTESHIVKKTLDDYRSEMNPARMFLMDHVEESRSGSISRSSLYSGYCRWIKENGYRPLSEKQFGREVRRIFSVVDARPEDKDTKKRVRVYENIQFSCDEICGEKISAFSLF
jgi:P4 family phage/plasmid primase-like protien